ncbi:unnamed protein product, partial [Amoebophrya sp. A25]
RGDGIDQEDSAALGAPAGAAEYSDDNTPTVGGVRRSASGELSELILSADVADLQEIVADVVAEKRAQRTVGTFLSHILKQTTSGTATTSQKPGSGPRVEDADHQLPVQHESILNESPRQLVKPRRFQQHFENSSLLLSVSTANPRSPLAAADPATSGETATGLDTFDTMLLDAVAARGLLEENEHDCSLDIDTRAGAFSSQGVIGGATGDDILLDERSSSITSRKTSLVDRNADQGEGAVAASG